MGDTIKNGRRGSLSGTLIVKGMQGHIAYPHLVKNPIHLAAPAIAELATTDMGQGQRIFSTDFLADFQHQRRHRRDQCGPRHGRDLFNFRFSTASTGRRPESKVHAILDRHSLEYDLKWELSGKPYLTPRGNLVEAVSGCNQSRCSGIATNFPPAAAHRTALHRRHLPASDRSSAPERHHPQTQRMRGRGRSGRFVRNLLSDVDRITGK